MQPVPIEDNEIWEGTKRRCISPPSGNLLDDDIRPCDALIGVDELGPIFAMKIVLDKGDLERLQADEPFWYIVHADHLHPFGFTF